MSQSYDKELAAIESVCRSLASSHALTDTQRTRLERQFGDRFKNAINLMEKRNVHIYRFKPSGRTIWTVKGRKGFYQIIPEMNFCNCDDYYYRVMDGQRALCYHIIAQKIAAAMGKYRISELRDIQYGEITEQWKTSPEVSP